MLWWWVACGWQAEPAAEGLARAASRAPTVGEDGATTLAIPSRLGRLAIWRDQVVWSVPEAILGVPLDGGDTSVIATLPDDCWSRDLAVAGGALWATCGAQLLRIDGASAEVVLEGDFVHGAAPGHGGVYTCRGTRLVRVRDDGASYETLADLGVVPHAAGGPSAAACVGAEVLAGVDAAYVRHASYVWAVPRAGGAARVVRKAPLVQAWGDRLLEHGLREGRQVWVLDDRELVETGLPHPHAQVHEGALYSQIRPQDGEGTALVRIPLAMSPGAPAPVPEVLARAEGPIEDFVVWEGVLAWADGSAPRGGRIRFLPIELPQTVH